MVNQIRLQSVVIVVVVIAAVAFVANTVYHPRLMIDSQTSLLLEPSGSIVVFVERSRCCPFCFWWLIVHVPTRPSVSPLMLMLLPPASVRFRSPGPSLYVGLNRSLSGAAVVSHLNWVAWSVLQVRSCRRLCAPAVPDLSTIVVVILVVCVCIGCVMTATVSVSTQNDVYSMPGKIVG